MYTQTPWEKEYTSNNAQNLLNIILEEPLSLGACQDLDMSSMMIILKARMFAGMFLPSPDSVLKSLRNGMRKGLKIGNGS